MQIAAWCCRCTSNLRATKRIYFLPQTLLLCHVGQLVNHKDREGEDGWGGGQTEKQTRSKSDIQFSNETSSSSARDCFVSARVHSSNIYEHVLDYPFHITCNLEAGGTHGASVNSLWRLLLSLPISLIGYLSSFYSSIWYSEDELLLLCLGHIAQDKSWTIRTKYLFINATRSS